MPRRPRLIIARFHLGGCHMTVAQVMKCSIDSSRWDAVKHRDRRADGLFLYGVKTTGVYCRPACSLAPAESRKHRLLHERSGSGKGGVPGMQALQAEYSFGFRDAHRSDYPCVHADRRS